MLRLAMWSGPRNVSTALLRSFGSRTDTLVCDEPLYANYLASTGFEHPLRDEIVERHESDWRKVVDWLTGPLPAGKTLFYQKHMAHHLLPDIDRAWLSGLTHAFLIREPEPMLASLSRIIPEPRLEDTGLPQQVELFRRVTQQRGAPPPVVDSRDLLADPEEILRKLCASVDIPFDPAMLAWEPGPRETDGCWGPAWYSNVYETTGFVPFKPSRVSLSGALTELAQRCRPLYAELYEHRLTARG